MNFDVLVLGCAKNYDIAKSYFFLANKFWNDSLNSTYFCVDYQSEERINYCSKIVVANSDSFRERILRGLESSNSKYVLIMLDDYFINREIKTDDLITIESLLDKNQIDYCRLIGNPRSFSKKIASIKHSRIISPAKHYGVNFQPSFWKRDLLYSFLKNENMGETAWEIESNFRFIQPKIKSICFNRNLLGIYNGVLRGKLFPFTNRRLKNVNAPLLTRQQLSASQYISFLLKRFVSLAVPGSVRRVCKKCLKHLGASFLTDD